MEIKQQFTPTEWKLVLHAPMQAAAWLMSADHGVVAFVKESKAIVEFAKQSRQKHADNELLALIANAITSPTTEGPEFNDFEIGQAKDQVTEAVRLVHSKLPTHSAAYRTFINELANTVANASGAGWFGSGAKVSDNERKILTQLADLLGSPVAQSLS